MRKIDELSQRWAAARKLWIELNREAVRFGETLLKLLAEKLGLGEDEELLEPIPPEPQRLPQIIRPSILTDLNSRRLADWMAEQFEVSDAVRFSPQRKRFALGFVLMVPGSEGSPPDFVPVFLEFMREPGGEFAVSVAGTNRECKVWLDDPGTWEPFIDFLLNEVILKRYPQTHEELAETLGVEERHIGFRPRFD